MTALRNGAVYIFLLPSQLISVNLSKVRRSGLDVAKTSQERERSSSRGSGRGGVIEQLCPAILIDITCLSVIVLELPQPRNKIPWSFFPLFYLQNRVVITTYEALAVIFHHNYF